MDKSCDNRKIVADLTGLLSGKVLGDRLSLALYSSDASIYQMEPLCVVVPGSEEDVARVVAYARGQGITVTARGAGSGLAGESLGKGIILDMSRFMNRVIKIDRQAGEVIVEPGVVLEELNRRLASIGKKIGPDPASGARATIGGMIGNNATGAHSLDYGYIGEHIRHLRVVSADGQIVEVGRDGNEPWADDLWILLRGNRDLLERARPKCRRNGSGYNVYPLLANGGGNLAELIAGSEGTLAIVTQAKLALVDVPAVKGLLQVNFDSLGKMARAVPSILEHKPAACELMDGGLLSLARQAYKQYRHVLPDGVAASLLVEMTGPSRDEVARRLRQLRLMVEGLPAEKSCIGTQEIIESAEQARVWEARKAAVPLLFRNKSASQPVAVIEDVAVDPRQMADYIEGVVAITRRLGVEIAYYGHVADGQLHPRPFFDLHKTEDVKKMRQLAQEVFKLAWSLGGTISGEHGEGLVRVSFIKQQYGNEMYELFRKVKQIFDPDGVLNPGKIINDDPDIMVKDLRFSKPIKRGDYQSNLIFHDNELAVEIQQCNGNGLCRSVDSQLSMCPIFRALRDEQAGPRAKANLMRHWLDGLLDKDVMRTKEFKRIADLCVNCKMCAMECPSLVNIPKLMMEARAEYVKHNGLTRSEFILTRSAFMSKLGGCFGGVANFFTQTMWFRWLLEVAGGLDRRRAMPRFAWRDNIGKLRSYIRQLGPVEKPVDKVAYFVDLFGRYNDHELGRAVVDVLRYNGIEVIVPDQRDAAMPAISYGDLRYARKVIEYNVARLAEVVRAGYKIVCSEPTAALCLRSEYLDVVDNEQSRLVAANTWELTGYLAGLHKEGRLCAGTVEVNLKLAYHEPCHYAALENGDGTLYLMRQIKGVKLEMLPKGCCGIAGTFGFQKKNFELSMLAGAALLKAFADSDANYGLTECGTCKMQMEFGDTKKVVHPIKVLAASYGLPISYH